MKRGMDWGEMTPEARKGVEAATITWPEFIFATFAFFVVPLTLERSVVGPALDFFFG